MPVAGVGLFGFLRAPRRVPEYLGCFVAVANFVRFALFAMEPLPNDDLVRFMFAGVKGGCSKDLCASAAASFAARSDPMFVSPSVKTGKLPATQATKDVASKIGKLPAMHSDQQRCCFLLRWFDWCQKSLQMWWGILAEQ